MAYGPVRGKKLAGRDVFWEREETDAALFRPGPCTYPSPLSTGESAAACACLAVLCGPERVLAATLPQAAKELSVSALWWVFRLVSNLLL